MAGVLFFFFVGGGQGEKEKVRFFGAQLSEIPKFGKMRVELTNSRKCVQGEFPYDDFQ